MNAEYIDIYCERTGPEFWSEPVNAITNFAFIISALFIAKLIRDQWHRGNRDVVWWIFCALIFIIGVGSWLFHTHATRWALLSDVIPIAIFILLILGMRCALQPPRYWSVESASSFLTAVTAAADRISWRVLLPRWLRWWHRSISYF